MESNNFLDLIKKAEEVEGRHFSSFVSNVRLLKKLGKTKQLEILLNRLIDAIEAGDNISHYGVAPWYYEELAKLYRRNKDYAKEVEILERFSNHRHAHGSKPAILELRYKRAKELLIRNQIFNKEKSSFKT